MMIEGPNAVALSGLAHSSKWLSYLWRDFIFGLVEEALLRLYVVFTKGLVDDVNGQPLVFSEFILRSDGL